jgi:hypothetical protein
VFGVESGEQRRFIGAQLCPHPFVERLSSAHVLGHLAAGA